MMIHPLPARSKQVDTNDPGLDWAWGRMAGASTASAPGTNKQKGGAVQVYGTPPRKHKVWPWVLGGAAIVMLCIGIMVVSLMPLINGGPARETARVNEMVSIADGIPTGDGWNVTESSDPVNDPGCIPLETSCHNLRRSWTTPVQVSLDELRDSTGYSMKTFTNPNCASGTVQEDYHVELCVRPYEVSLRMYDK